MFLHTPCMQYGFVTRLRFENATHGENIMYYSGNNPSFTSEIVNDIQRHQPHLKAEDKHRVRLELATCGFGGSVTQLERVRIVYPNKQSYKI